ncbi:MAG TPA: OB-fold domain-containing protein [Baekduia sp.]
MIPTPAADPRPTPLAQPFWDGCARRALVLQRCADCPRYIHFPKERCPTCRSDRLTWEEVPATGTLATFTEVHRTFAPGFEEQVPYVVGVAELDVQAGLRIVANVADPVATLSLGAPVVVGFAERPGFGLVPTLTLT